MYFIRPIFWTHIHFVHFISAFPLVYFNMFGQNLEISLFSCLIMFSWINACLSNVEFQKLWRSVPVDSIDDEKIEEYLKKQGISSMQETGPKKVVSVCCCPICLIFILAPQISTDMPWFVSLEIKAFKFLLCWSSILIGVCVSGLPTATSAKEEEARWAEEETLQDPQQPSGRCPGGLFGWRPCKEVRSSPSLLQALGGAM